MKVDYIPKKQYIKISPKNNILTAQVELSQANISLFCHCHVNYAVLPLTTMPYDYAILPLTDHVMEIRLTILQY